MESIIVYRKIPHPGIQVNLDSYYSKQVGALSRDARARRRRGGARGRRFQGGSRRRVPWWRRR